MSLIFLFSFFFEGTIMSSMSFGPDTTTLPRETLGQIETHPSRGDRRAAFAAQQPRRRSPLCGSKFVTITLFPRNQNGKKETAAGCCQPPVVPWKRREHRRSRGRCAEKEQIKKTAAGRRWGALWAGGRRTTRTTSASSSLPTPPRSPRSVSNLPFLAIWPLVSLLYC
jgi:hypothetical protein